MSKYVLIFTNKECNSKNFHLVKDHHICEFIPFQHFPCVP